MAEQECEPPKVGQAASKDPSYLTARTKEILIAIYIYTACCSKEYFLKNADKVLQYKSATQVKLHIAFLPGQ